MIKIDWNSLDFKKSNGIEKIRCPECDSTRSDKRDKSLTIWHNNGTGKCFYCDAMTFRDEIEIQKEYTLPKQDWQNFTKLSENLVKWVESERSIGQHTLIQLGITEEKHYQPALQKEVNNIVFNYFEGNTVVNKKYRSGNKKFTQSAGGKAIFYNINSVVGEKEVYIVEGEFDVLALHHIGIKNAISVPNGANDNDDYWKNSEKYLNEIERFIIAVDNDEKGNELKERIAQRLGRWRCEFIEWENKDANGDLKAGVIKQGLENVKRFPVCGTVTVSDLRDGIFELYNNGLPKTLKLKHESFKSINEIFSLMKGHLCTVTGIPSHGKSEFTEWLGLNLVNDYKMKLSLFTPEHSPFSLHQTRMIPKAVGKPFWKSQPNNCTPADIERYIKWADQKIYYTTPDRGQLGTWDWILDTFKEQMYAYGVDIFMIDAFNKLLGAPSKEEKDEVLTRLTQFAQVNNVLILLIAHPTKMKQLDDGTYNMPTLYDVSGTSDFRNQTHDGYVIHRDFKNNDVSFCNLKTKFGFQGKIGESVKLNYDLATGRYYIDKIPTFDMTISKEVEPLKLQPNEDWEQTDDMPF